MDAALEIFVSGILKKATWKTRLNLPGLKQKNVSHPNGCTDNIN